MQAENIAQYLGATGVEYGTSHSTDTCFMCWLAGKDVDAVAEAFTPDDTERTPLCYGHYVLLVGCL